MPRSFRQRNSRDENEQVKAGTTPKDWKRRPAKIRQKDKDEGNTSSNVYADSAYRPAETERKLKARGFRSRIHKRGRRNRPLSDAETEANSRKSK